MIEDHLGEPWQIAILLAVFAGVLWWADQRPERADIPRTSSMRQGCSSDSRRALALAPGVSRSGVTIKRRVFLGPTRDAAARLSFLLLVPIVLGAVLLKGLKDVVFGDLPAGWVGPFVVGTLTAAGSRAARDPRGCSGTCAAMTIRCSLFYRLAIAAAILILIATGARSATF